MSDGHSVLERVNAGIAVTKAALPWRDGHPIYSPQRRAGPVRRGVLPSSLQCTRNDEPAGTSLTSRADRNG
jgi:hypothetical protein